MLLTRCQVKLLITHINVLLQARRKFASTSRSVSLSYATYESPKGSLWPPIFIFHGVIGNKKQWEDVGKHLMNITKRNVVAVDLRNHGDSTHTNSHKYTELAEDVLSLFEQLGTQQASLIGHSMGGRTAICVALMAPHKVAGLQVVDISPISMPTGFKEYIRKLLYAMKAVNFDNMNKVSIAKKYATELLREVVSDDIFLNDILTNVGVKKDGNIGWICNIDVLIKDYDYWVSFPKVKRGVKYYGPTLFVGGQLSDFIPPDELIKIRAMFPRAVVTYIKKTGHGVQADDLNNFLNLTCSFINTHKYKVWRPVIKR